jgi:hypothetical protein
MFNPQKPPEGSAIRERSFKDIPFLNRLTLYAEDKVTVHLGQTFLDLQAGLRFNYILPDDKLKVNELSCLEPRLNVNWVVAQRNAGLKYLSFRGSWGVNNKMPTMAYLYPEIEYFDRQLFAYSDQDYNFNLFTTHKFENIVNENLKMPKSVKIEFGTDFHIYQINGSFAYYNEHLTNAYQFEKQFQSYALPMWQSTAYFGSGAKFSWDGNKLFQIDEGQPKLLDPMRTDTGFLDYDKSSNGGEIRTWGIEYTLDFGTIKAIKTQVHIDGAYISVSKTNSANVGEQVGNYETKNKVFGVAYYKGAASVANVTINDRLNTNIRFITHIPKLGIVTTLTVQAIWHEGMQQRSNLAYYVDGAVSPHKVNPDYYVDIYGTRHRFQAEWADPDYVPEWVTEADRDKYKNYYGDMIKAEPSNYFLYQRWSPYMLMNIRVTKEIKEKVTISFYANNFLNQEGNSKNSVTKISLKKNSSTPIYFGAEVKFKF